MISFDEVRGLVLADPRPSTALAELRARWAQGPSLEELRPGELDASEALAMYVLRQQTTAAAGVMVYGLDDLLEQLAAVPATDSVVLFHLGAADRLFTVVVHERTRALLGAVAVARPSKDR